MRKVKGGAQTHLSSSSFLLLNITLFSFLSNSNLFKGNCVFHFLSWPSEFGNPVRVGLHCHLHVTKQHQLQIVIGVELGPTPTTNIANSWQQNSP